MEIEEAIRIVSEQTEIDETVFKVALGILPECPATTISEALEIYKHASGKSAAEAVARQKLNKLCLEALQEVTTFSEALKIHACTLENSEAQAVALRKMVELATTIDESKEVYIETSVGSEAEAVALRKMVEIQMNSTKQPA